LRDAHRHQTHEVEAAEHVEHERAAEHAGIVATALRAGVQKAELEEPREMVQALQVEQ
jgi:hypothetical protein